MIYSMSITVTTSDEDVSSNGVLLPACYADYDHICCIQDIPESPSKHSSMIKRGTFFTSCVLVSLIGGFGLNIIINNKNYREGLKVDSTQQAMSNNVSRGGSKVVMLEDPMMFATRALGWGTLYAIIGSGTVGLTAVCIWKL